MNVLMVGVDKGRIGGMWTVAELFIEDSKFNDKVNLTYVATSTCGTKIKRLAKMISGYIKILYFLLTGNIDIVHVHMAERGSVFRKGIVIIISKLLNKKVVIQMHAGPFVYWYDSLNIKKQSWVKKILNSSDEVLVLGKFWKEQLKSLVPEEKIHVVYNGTKIPMSNNYNLNATDIVYLGLLKKEKGTYDLVDAIHKIDQSLPKQAKVLLCGNDEENSFEKYIENKGLKGRIILTGWISKKKIIEIFKNTAIVVLPSYFEALSMTVIEAMSYGIPVVTTNISTMGELLGEEIYKIAPGDVNALSKEILELYNNKQLREKESEIEYQRAKQYFSTEIMIKNVLEVYSKILGCEKI